MARRELSRKRVPLQLPKELERTFQTVYDDLNEVIDTIRVSNEITTGGNAGDIRVTTDEQGDPVLQVNTSSGWATTSPGALAYTTENAIASPGSPTYRYIDLEYLTVSPEAPLLNQSRVYFKTDGLPYYRRYDGTEVNIIGMLVPPGVPPLLSGSVAYWTGYGMLSGETDFAYNSTTNKLTLLGSFGIGVLPTHSLDIFKAHTLNATEFTAVISSTFVPSASPVAFTRYVQLEIEGGISGSYLTSDIYMQSVRIAPYVLLNTSAPYTLTALQIDPYVGDGGTTLPLLMGINTSIGHYGTGAVTDLRHINIGGVTITSGGTVTAQYGIYIANLNQGGTNYAIYSVGATQSYHAGTFTMGASLYVTNNIVTYQSEYITDTDAAAWLILSSGATTNYYNAGLLIQHDSTTRWGIYKSSDAAATLLISRYNDAGAWQAEALYINRSNGYIGTEANVGIAGAPNASYPLYVYGDGRFIKAGTTTLIVGGVSAADNGVIQITGNDTAFGYTGTLQAPTLTAARVWTFPNVTGTVYTSGNAPALNEIANPTGDKTFNMTTRQLSFLWTNPSGNPLELEASGAYTGALLHIHQHTGNPGAAYLLTLESSDTDIEHISSKMPGADNHVLCVYVSGDTKERFVLHAGGRLEWGAGGAAATDTNLYRSAANNLKTDDNLYIAESLYIGTATSVAGAVYLYDSDIYSYKITVSSDGALTGNRVYELPWFTGAGTKTLAVTAGSTFGTGSVWNGNVIDAAYIGSHTHSAASISSGTFASAAPSQYRFQDEVRIDGLLGVGRDPTTYAIELNGSIGFYGTNQITGAGGGTVTWAGQPIGSSYIGSHTHAASDIASGTLATDRGGTNLSTFTANGFMYASSTSVLATSTNLSTDGSKVTKYNSVTTEGFGVPAIVDLVDSEISAAVSATNCSNSATTGVYRMSVQLTATGYDANGSYTLSLKFKDGPGNTLTQTMAAVDTVDIGSIAGSASATYTMHHHGQGSTSVQYEVTKSGGNSSDTVNCVVVLERLN